MAQTVLIVDDEEYVCRLMRLILERSGYNVIQAQSAEEGLKLLRKEKPDVVTVDLMMPERDGLHLLAEMQADPEISGVPSIIVTAVGIQADLDRALELGARAAIAKPFSRHQLVYAVDQVLR